MSTRSVVAIRDFDSTDPTAWKGRYVHFDGYPEGVGDALRAIIERDGVTAATITLVRNHNGWSSIDATYTGEQGGRGGGGVMRFPSGRFEAVKGYGIAYTPDEQPDEWYTSETIKDHAGYIEWVHVIEPDGTVTSTPTAG